MSHHLRLTKYSMQLPLLYKEMGPIKWGCSWFELRSLEGETNYVAIEVKFWRRHWNATFLIELEEK